MTSGVVIPMVFEGVDAVDLGRKLIGPSDPKLSMPGTIRGDYSMHVAHSVVHGSDTPEAAEKETHLWFKETELVSWISCDVAFISS